MCHLDWQEYSQVRDRCHAKRGAWALRNDHGNSPKGGTWSNQMAFLKQRYKGAVFICS